MSGRHGAARRRLLLMAGIGLALVLAAAAFGPLSELTRPSAGGCARDLPPGALDAVTDAAVYRVEETFDPRLGEYTCVLYDRDDRRLLSVAALSDRDAVRSALVADLAERVHEETSLQALPDGLPGLVTHYGWFHLLPPCPGLERPDDGFDHRPLVTVRGPSGEVGEGTLALAVALTNAVAERLDCGAPPLRHEGGFRAAEPTAAEEAAGTPCGVLATGPLPEPRRGGWTVSAAATDTAPAGRCTLRTTDGQTALVLTSWFGEWGLPIIDAQHRWYADSARQGQLRGPYLGTNWAWAAAICDGAPAHFGLRLSRPWREFDAGVLHAVLDQFARDQVARRDCHDLRMPELPAQE